VGMAENENRSQQDWVQLDDEILIKAHLKGDPEAFEVLFKKHFANVSRLVFSVVKDDTLTQDIVQDVFLLVHRYLPKFRAESSFRTWVYRITVNEAVRQGNRARRWVPFIDQNGEDVPPAPALIVVSNGPSPERVLLDGEQHQMVTEALAGLKPPHRAILSLYYLEELPIQEIAQILSIPEGSVKSRLFYARESLKKILEPRMGFADTRGEVEDGARHEM
jgi:RNA polymerase sigma-70 factor (ECF subfamily)